MEKRKKKGLIITVQFWCTNTKNIHYFVFCSVCTSTAAGLIIPLDIQPAHSKIMSLD